MVLVRYLFFISLIAIVGCSKPSKNRDLTDSYSTADSSRVIDTLETELTEPKSLEDSIMEIRKWFKSINSNVDNYHSKKSVLVDSLSQTTVIEYFNGYEKNRMKLIYKSDTLRIPHFLLSDSDSLINITREYYYWDNNLFFVFEILNLLENNSSLEKMENRYYFDQNKMIRWLNDKNDMSKSNVLYQKAEETIKEKPSKDILYPYNYAKKYISNDRLIEGDSVSGIVEKYSEILKWRAGNNASVELKFVNRQKDRHVFEVMYPLDAKIKSTLYVLETNGEPNTINWSIKDKLIGHLYRDPNKMKTPGDFFYSMVSVVDQKDLEKLKKSISKDGYRQDITVMIGDVSEAQYDTTIVVSRQNMTFHDLKFNFSLDAFNYHLSIAEAYNSENESSFQYWGGGFSEKVMIKKDRKGIYLVSFSSNDH
jgi:hypothetical protein